ncbi:hypothetical protein J6590_081026 [Homalodisca vitripennis]|nr:hypothetical protein J6590_081026 [Homalodisca vitripennis]
MMFALAVYTIRFFKDIMHHQMIGVKHYNCVLEISKISECRAKYHSLRTSYARYLRELKKNPCSSIAKKKQWYLAEDMSFLENFITTNKFSVSDVVINDEEAESLVVEADFIDDASLEDEKFPPSMDQPASEDGSNPQMRKKKRRPKTALVAAPVVAYVKSINEIKKFTKRTSDDPTINFFKSILPDVKKLSEKRRRDFKSFVLEKLNSLLDEQEEDEISEPSLSSQISN